MKKVIIAIIIIALLTVGTGIQEMKALTPDIATIVWEDNH